MSEAFDVIVVGARCAGASLATMLARRGLAVCLLDKDRFPSETLSTHGIQPAGVQVLGRLGVLDSLLELAPPIRRLRIASDEGLARATDLEALVGGPALSVRRLALDQVLLDAAVAAGAEVRTHTPATGLTWEEGRATGVTTAAGTLRARLVIGADGARSSIAKFVGAPERHPTSSGRVFMWAYYDVDPTGGEMWIGKLGDHTYLTMPTDGGLTVVAVCPSIGRRDEVRAGREAVYEEGLRAWPELHAGLAGAERDGPVRTMANLNGFFRPAAGPGWALVGDAGHFKDPTAGQGIADALRQSEKLATVIAAAIGTGHAADTGHAVAARDPLDAALQDWRRWRDDDAWEMYWFAHDMGSAGPTPPWRRAAQRRIDADPETTAAMVRILNHELRPSQVFTPGFFLATSGEALRRGRGERRAITREIFATAGTDLRRTYIRAKAATPL
jgi:2-polyprenyl-6-methoxyphenol hydroxylase-like FAD-dependent oxidoreductase